MQRPPFDSLSKDLTGSTERCRDDGDTPLWWSGIRVTVAHLLGRVCLEPRARITVPEAQAAIGTGRGEGAVGFVERNVVDGEDVLRANVGARSTRRDLHSVAFEREV